MITFAFAIPNFLKGVIKLEVALSRWISDNKIKEGMFWAGYLFFCAVSVLWTSSGPNICKRYLPNRA
jgi:hypothetical protein